MISLRNTPYTFRYNAIPLDLIGRKILEIGCGENIFDSHIGEKVLTQADTYRCIDPVKASQLSSIEGDITKMELTEKYDTILMIEVLEHIHLRDWIPVVDKLKGALKPQGNLIISVPARQKLEDYLMYWNTDYWEIHTVFGITEKALTILFPDFRFKRVKHTVFRHDEKALLWAIARLVKRKILKNFPVLRQSFIMFWKNE